MIASTIVPKALPGLIALAVSSAVFADGVKPPPPDKVCVAGAVDRELLAKYLLRSYDISWLAAAEAGNDTKSRFQALPVEQRLIADTTLCPDPSKLPDGTENPCGDKDYASLNSAYVSVASLLNGEVPDYRSAASKTSPTRFFLNADVVIACVNNGAPKANEPSQDKNTASKDKKGANPLRIRGAQDMLYLRSTDDDGFKSADKAQLSFSDDQAQSKRTKKMIGAVGYGIVPFDRDGNVLQIIPYLAINDALTNKTGKATDYTSKTRDVGTVVSWQWPGPFIGPSFTNILTIRPDFLWNNQDESRLMSINATYVPIVGKLLNAQVSGDEQSIEVRTMFDIRLDEGHYTTFGRAPAGTLDDYLRLGTRAGLDFTTLRDMPHPLDWSVSETFLHAFHGRPGDIRYFKSTLSLGLDAKKNFSLDLSYSNGRLETTGEPDRGWSIGFGAKY
jgi:hypothetical protein